MKKIKNRIPKLQIAPTHKNTIYEFIRKNIDNFNFNTDFLLNDIKNFKITIHEVGRTFSKGKGLYFSSIDKSPKPVKIFNPKEYNQIDQISSRFCYYYLKKGIYFYEGGQKKESLKMFLKAIDIVSFCYPAYVLICKHFKKERKKYCPLAIDNTKFHPYFKQNTS